MTPEEIQLHLRANYQRLDAEGTRWKDSLNRRLRLRLTDRVPLLFQYTNVTGLNGIISEKELWATNLAYCNDSSEFHYGIGKFIEVINARRVTAANSVKRRIATDLIDRLERKDRSDTYVYCLTEHGDQLSQWRGYGDSGYGYSVGFDFDGVTNLYGVATHSWVLYNEVAHAKMCEKVAVALVSDLIRSLPRGDVANAATTIADIVMEDIDTGLPFFKHPAFAEEREYRLFSSVKDLARYQNVHDFPVYLRVGQNMLVPYVKLTVRAGGPNTPLPIRQIIIGPKVNFDKAEQSLRLLLRQNGYPEDIVIEPSKVPFI